MVEYIKIKDKDRNRLAELKGNDHVRKMLVDEGIKTDVKDDVYYNDLLELMMRDDYGVKSHTTSPVRCHCKEYYVDLAGENTSINRIVSDHLELFEQELSEYTERHNE